MRTFLITTLILTAGVFLSATVSAQADITTFDFIGGSGGIENTGDDSEISEYMTRVYGSAVNVTDAEVRDNDDDTPDWVGKDLYDNFLRCDMGSGDLEIHFPDRPIISACGDGYVFDTTSGYDFLVIGYDDSYGGNVENPLNSAFVGFKGFQTDRIGGGYFNITFSRPVSLLVFSDGGVDDIGIDNLCVQAVPTPSAILLGSLGMGITGWLKRRRTL